MVERILIYTFYNPRHITYRILREINFPNQDFFEATWKLPSQEGVIFSANASNGPCNRSVYLICHIIKENNLKTKLAFVHIPSEFEFEKAQKIIEAWVLL